MNHIEPIPRLFLQAQQLLNIQSSSVFLQVQQLLNIQR